ncbi:hypothetical protein [Pelagicoccus sp. SDUM812005]|uniref:hypothetical protein n=1 Tax=Pelagicoccus sp. SDUM812005 TaxID=3041257 RepID=UPI00280C7F74|nr:hypothetical protein [Pelagicoccus sp. SDUM812005]MDQ8182845.1 hypothetical protein [Pelagicoccus sp. SDUM812005]
MKSKPYSLKRYALRIFLPVALVSLIGFAMRWQMGREFVEKRVERVEVEEESTEKIRKEVPFSEENRTHVINALEQALEVMEDGEREVDEAALDRLQRSIDRLGAVEEAEWQAAVEEAYEALAQARES